jgi:hypothetical protein
MKFPSPQTTSYVINIHNILDPVGEGCYGTQCDVFHNRFGLKRSVFDHQHRIFD